MRGLFVSTAALFFVAPSAFATLIATEQFNYTAGTAPTSTIVGQTPATGHTWDYTTGTSPTTPLTDDGVINSTSLTPTGPYTLPDAFATSGGSYSYGGKQATYLLPIGARSAGTTLYYSMLLQVSDITGLTTTTGGIIAGFSNLASGSMVNPPTSISALFAEAGADAGTFRLSVERNATPTSTNYSSEIPLGNTVFVVVAHQIVSSTNNDVVSLWINPDVSTLGATPPTPTIQGVSTGGDANLSTGSFILYQRGSNPAQFGNTGVTADEIRIGTTWADVTLPEPASVGFVVIGLAAMARRRNTRRV